MNKFYIYIILFCILNGCSTDTKTGFWSNKDNTGQKEKNEEILFKTNNVFNAEVNTNIKIKLKENYQIASFVNNLKNNNKILNYNGDLDLSSKFKFSKLTSFDVKNSEMLVTNNGEIIIFDGKGNISKLTNDLKLLWSFNFYSKKEKKLKPSINLAHNKESLVITDNLSNLYSLNLNNGKLIWKKKHSSAFNSQIKIFNEKIYSIDIDNSLQCFNIKNGEKIWEFKSESTLIKSSKKSSIIINKNKIIYLSAVGDLNAIDIKNGDLIWQTPTQSISLFEDAFTTIYSDLVYEGNSVYFSNNKNELFAINTENGAVKWKNNVGSVFRPLIIDKIVITISENNYLIIINSDTGDIIRSTKIKNKKKNLEFVGFILAKDKIFLSTISGVIIQINLFDGKILSENKINKKIISRPIVNNKSMYIISNSIIKKYN